MTAWRLWFALTAYGATAIASLLLVDRHSPPGRWPAPAAVAGGIATGWLLFAVLARVRPRLPARLPLACVLIGAAAAEEIVWRRLVLGELAAHVAPLSALLVSSLLFAFGHVHARATHVLTGATFGALYLISGGVLSGCCAHGAYNLAVAGACSRRGSSPGVDT
jgi:membrane protease YdiL (CAAX protease family)